MIFLLKIAKEEEGEGKKVGLPFMSASMCSI